MRLETILDQDWRSTGWLGGGWLGGRHNGHWDSIHWLTHNCGIADSWVQQGLLRDERWEMWDQRWTTGCAQETVDHEMMDCSVYAVLSVYCTWGSLKIMAWRHRDGRLNFVFLGDGRVEHANEHDERAFGKSSYKTGIYGNFVCESIYHAWYGTYKHPSWGPEHWYEIF